MPRINRGAVGAIALYAQERRKAKEKREEEERETVEKRYLQDREFQNRLLLAGIRYGQPVVPKPPSETEVTRLSLGLTPGQPMSAVPRPVEVGTHPTTGQPINRLGGGLPSTEGGRQLVNQLIEGGQTQSPGALSLGERRYLPNARGEYTIPAPPAPPTPPYGPGFTMPPVAPAAPSAPPGFLDAVRGSLPYLAGPAGILAQSLMRRPRPQTNAPPDDPIAQKIQQFLQQGIPLERIASDLRAKGVDPAQYGL